MNKIISSLIAFLFVLTTAVAQSYTSPNTGVVLSLDDIAAASPSTITVDGDEYTLLEDITISENDTLLIDTDLTLFMDEDILITIQGVFTVDAEEVTFTALDEELPYSGFRFEQGSDITIRNATFEYGGGLRVLTEDFLVEWCVFLDIVGGGATTSAVIQVSRGVPVIQHNLIGHNYLPAIGSAANGAVSPYIFDNMILDNNLENSNRPQINLGTSMPDEPIRIIENLIIGDQDATMVGGIALANLVGGSLLAEVSGNIIAENRYGITVIGPSNDVRIFDNIIEDNNTQNEPMLGGSGISLSSGQSGNPVQVYNNEFRGNLWGITNIDSLINLGDDEDNPGQNIFSENGNGGVTYALYNNSANEIMAKNNCWIEGQLSTPEEVEDVIFHAVDDSSLGEVIFDPFLCGVLSVDNHEFVDFSFYPNPVKNEINFNNTHSFETMDIYGVQGNLILSEAISEGQNTMNINLSSGLYFVKFSGNGASVTKKMIVE